MNKKETRNRFGLTVRDMETIREVFKKYPQVEIVYLFGSRAMGTHRLGSDVDLAIMQPPVGDETVRRLKADFAESSLPYQIDVIAFPDLSHTELKAHIQRVGVVFYERWASQP